MRVEAYVCRENNVSPPKGDPSTDLMAREGLARKYAKGAWSFQPPQSGRFSILTFGDANPYVRAAHPSRRTQQVKVSGTASWRSESCDTAAA